LNQISLFHFLESDKFMSWHVGHIGIIPQVEKTIPEELGGPQALNREDPNFSLEQGKP
jgi:hypothetical protein